jgi:hypothetical protein
VRARCALTDDHRLVVPKGSDMTASLTETSPAVLTSANLAAPAPQPSPAPAPAAQSSDVQVAAPAASIGHAAGAPEVDYDDCETISSALNDWAEFQHLHYPTDTQEYDRARRLQSLFAACKYQGFNHAR